MTSTPTLANNAGWSESIGNAISLLGKSGFYQALSDAFSYIPETVNPLVLYYPEGARPQALFSSYLEREEHHRQVEKYLDGPYILDPFYRASLNGVTPGAYRLREVAPDNFKRTEFYRVYYKGTNLDDELSYLQPLPDNGHLHLSVAHSSDKGHFSARTIRFLKAVSPIVNALLLQQWLLDSSSGQKNDSTSIHGELLRALQLFGSSLLTEREQAVLQLILHGHSNKSASSRLDIAVSTVKLHRKHIYQKLDISSQSELFYLFIDSLSCLDPAEDRDPLQPYMDLPH